MMHNYKDIQAAWTRAHARAAAHGDSLDKLPSVEVLSGPLPHTYAIGNCAGLAERPYIDGDTLVIPARWYGPDCFGPSGHYRERIVAGGGS